MKVFMFFLALCMTTPVFAEPNCEKHPLYCSIVELRPKINKKWAMDFSNKLHKYSKRFQMDPYRSLAIAMQESRLRQINRTQTILVTERHESAVPCDDPSVAENPIKHHEIPDMCRHEWFEHKYIKGVTDVGPFQFHIGTIRRHKIDPVRLQNDLDYSTMWHFKLLKSKIELCKKRYDNTAWACYHSSTPHLHKVYVELVNRYYKKEVSDETGRSSVPEEHRQGPQR